MKNPQQEKLFEAMSQADFYPHPVGRIEQKETHISRVFLTGDYVYKVKKPVDLGFLDFSSLAKRRWYCALEVTLNRRLTRDVYLDAVEITSDGSHFSLVEPGMAVEVAVRMRQLPDACSMASLLKRNCISEQQIEALATMLTDFYENQKRVPPTSTDKSWENLQYACEENFRQTRWAMGRLLDAHLYQSVKSAIRFFLQRGEPLFDRRRKTGKIYDGHGDLRCGHIYYLDKNRIQIIDCIEFNNRLRTIDIASDLAFLAMDLDFRSAYPMDALLLEAYARKTGDLQAYALFPFYKCYRAMVRCKVNCIRLKAGHHGEKARSALNSLAARYLSLAHGYANHVGRPTIWVFCGLPASGKSTLARHFSTMLATTALRSDVIRKKSFGIHPEKTSPAAFAQGIYGHEANRLTYERLLKLAGEILIREPFTVLDATFSLPEQRRQVIRLAEKMNGRAVFIECTAPEPLLRDRLLQREKEPSVSDARVHHFTLLKRKYVPPDEVDLSLRLQVDTQRPVHDCIRSILSWDYKASLASAVAAQRKGGCHVQNHSGGNRPGYGRRSVG